MAGAACMAPAQLGTVARFGSKMICEPTAEGRAGQETFHHSHSHTPRPITSNTSFSQIGKNTRLLSVIGHVVTRCFPIYICLSNKMFVIDIALKLMH